MMYIFWQNTLSLHQSAFLRSLSEISDVILIAEDRLSESRINSGWEIPDFGKTQIILAPNEYEIEKLLNKDALHIFTGIRSFKIPGLAFQKAVKKRLRIGVISEPFNWIGFKGKLRFLKYMYFRLKYGKQIDFILAIGNRGRWCFEVTGFDKQKIYDWAYFTETYDMEVRSSINEKPTLLFVGRIDENKDVLSLAVVCKKHKDQINELVIIGDGPLKKSLLQLIQDTNFKYLGILPNKDVVEIMNQVDLLILPTIYKDGWGAVINEALMCGVPVIASDHCGASILLQHIRGRVFSIKENGLEKTIMDFLPYLPYDIVKKESIRRWAMNNLTGKVASDYFELIIRHVYYSDKQKPQAPWLKISEI